MMISRMVLEWAWLVAILQPVIQCPNVHGARELISYSTAVIQTGEGTNGMQVCEGEDCKIYPDLISITCTCVELYMTA